MLDNGRRLTQTTFSILFSTNFNGTIAMRNKNLFGIGAAVEISCDPPRFRPIFFY